MGQYSMSISNGSLLLISNSIILFSKVKSIETGLFGGKNICMFLNLKKTLTFSIFYSRLLFYVYVINA